ncbi:MAG: hypothetical protein WA130_14975 [Candidatus Methanoperedens sp.]
MRASTKNNSGNSPEYNEDYCMLDLRTLKANSCSVWTFPTLKFTEKYD